MPTLLTVTDKKAHAQLRKPIANIFTMDTVAQFEPLVDSIMVEFVKALAGKSADEPALKKACAIDRWLQCCK